MELFEQIRRDYEFGSGTISGVARSYGVHRRMVRQALQDALPPERKQPERQRPVLSPVMSFVDDVLATDQRMPRKQRHTARRIWRRIQAEMPEHPGRRIDDPPIRTVQEEANGPEWSRDVRSTEL